MKTFDIPEYYRSNIITPLKEFRRKRDKLKRDFTPTVLDFGPIRFYIARHFGFCYGVENAVEIAYKAIAENPDKRIFLLSEMIHNPDVNADLQDRGVRFIMDTNGRQLIPWSELTPNDVIIIPAFGTTLETQHQLSTIGLDIAKYDTTCPFVEKVWNKAAQIGQKDYTVVVHGKPSHEETRATFSHSKEAAPTVVVRDMAQAQRLAGYITGELPAEQFYIEFAGQFSDGFEPARDLQRIGVVNQTTMLASDTQGIADYLKQVMTQTYSLSPEQVEAHFANTRDTLCYATNDNQDATYALLGYPANFAIVAGGYNSSNTSHIVELCAEKLPTYFIESEQKILSETLIRHFDNHAKQEIVTENFIPRQTGNPGLQPVTVLLTCGASCPDAVVEGILLKLVSFFPNARPIGDVMAAYQN